MKRLLCSALLALTGGVFFVSCSDSGGGIVSGLTAALGEAETADLSGQRNMFNGTLGSGKVFTFPAVKGQEYTSTITLTDNDDEVTYQVFSQNGYPLDRQGRKNGEVYRYTHEEENQHILVLIQPDWVWNTDIGVSSLYFVGVGPHDQTHVHVNFIVAGTFAGLGIHNNLATSQDQGDFVAAVLQKVNQIYAQTGISVTAGWVYYTADQVRATDGSLVDGDMAICSAGESTNSTGFSLVNTSGLDRWGKLAFPENHPDYDTAHGIDVVIMHHFTEDGTVGLSPRPGILLGAGNDTALAAATFLRQNNVYYPRSVDQIGLVVAHEMGHFLGLLHTTTFSPDPYNPDEAIDDGLTDTPKCTVLADTNNDGLVGVGDGCQDEANVMFYQSNPANQTTLTDMQDAVMKAMLSVQEH